MKRCPGCKELLALTEFWKNRLTKDGHQVRCKHCMRAYREEHKERYRAYMREYKRQRRQHANEYERRSRQNRSAFVRSMKEGRPCADCGGVFPTPAMEFDHVRGEKLGSVSNMARSGGFSIDVIRAEIEKCDLVCANCHRIRHHAKEPA